MYYTKINQIQFNNGKELDIKDNDIIVFVGPNNSGKSQSLKDIYRLITEDSYGVVVHKVKFTKGEKKYFAEALKKYSCKDSGNPSIFKGIGFQYSDTIMGVYDNLPKIPESLRPFVVSFLSTADRLKLADETNAIDIDDVKTHPIHYLLYDKGSKDKVSDYFSQAFGKKMVPDASARHNVSLRIGEVGTIKQDTPVDDAQIFMAQAYSKLPKVHEQGDGVRSFAGVLINMIIPHYGIFLIDEPESFLHPPQAKILGNVIADMLGDNRQAFISTHSEALIHGLIEKAPERIKVIRITREEDTNDISILENEKFKELWDDPLLRHSNIMESLFHKNVVVCESDSDCHFYSVILNYIKQKENRYAETLFVCCGGKQRLHSVVTAMKSLSIDFRCVTDIDIFHVEGDFQKLLESAGCEWTDELRNHYKVLTTAFKDEKVNLSKATLQAKFQTALDDVSGDTLTQEQLSKVRKSLKVDSKWDAVKAGGETMIPAGEQRVAYNKLVDKARKFSVFVVPVGELECFVKAVGGHGPTWVNNVFETYKDFESPEYETARKFVKSLNL